MLTFDSSSRSRYAGIGWFGVAAATSVAASVVGRLAGAHSTDPSFHYGLVLSIGQLCPVVTGLAILLMVSCRADAWLLPLASLNLVLLEAGRAGDVTSWRLEWAVGGTIITVLAVALFSRLLFRADEMQRRIYLQGAALGLLGALLLAMGYTLFERWLPPLRAQWVTTSLLLLWWAGWLVTAFRYR